MQNLSDVVAMLSAFDLQHLKDGYAHQHYSYSSSITVPNFPKLNIL